MRRVNDVVFEMTVAGRTSPQRRRRAAVELRTTISARCTFTLDARSLFRTDSPASMIYSLYIFSRSVAHRCVRWRDAASPGAAQLTSSSSLRLSQALRGHLLPGLAPPDAPDAGSARRNPAQCLALGQRAALRGPRGRGRQHDGSRREPAEGRLAVRRGGEARLRCRPQPAQHGQEAHGLVRIASALPSAGHPAS
jgi:hypothetical protein